MATIACESTTRGWSIVDDKIKQESLATSALLFLRRKNHVHVSKAEDSEEMCKNACWVAVFVGMSGCDVLRGEEEQGNGRFGVLGLGSVGRRKILQEKETQVAFAYHRCGGKDCVKRYTREEGIPFARNLF